MLSEAVLAAKRMQDPPAGSAQKGAAATTLSKKLDGEAVTHWARTWLEQKLGSLSVKLFGGLANGTFTTPEVSGHARRGEDGCAPFSFRLACEWKVHSSIGGEAWGMLLVPEFNSE